MEEMKSPVYKFLSINEKYAIICFLESLYTYDSRWECVLKEIKAKFSHLFDLKVDNEILLSWESIPHNPD